MERITAVGIFCLIFVFKSCNGYCINQPIQSEILDSRRIRYFCMLQTDDPGSSTGPQLKILLGSKVHMADSCLTCTCSMDGLQCCGFGHAGGVVALPSDCEKRLDGCQAMFVKKHNSSLACFTGEPINFAALSAQSHPDNQQELVKNINVDLDQLVNKQPLPMNRFSSLLPSLRLPWGQQSGWTPISDANVNSHLPFNDILSSLMRNPSPNTMRRVSIMSSSGSPEPHVTSEVIPLTSHHSSTDPANDMLPWLFFN